MLQFVEASCTYRNSLIGENYVTSEEQSIILITSFILGDAVFQYMLQHQCPIQKCIALQGTTFHERIVCVLVFVEAHNTILTFSYYILFQLKYFGQRARCWYILETNMNPGKEERKRIECVRGQPTVCSKVEEKEKMLKLAVNSCPSFHFKMVYYLTVNNQ